MAKRKALRHDFAVRGHKWRVQSDERGRFDEIVVLIGRTCPPKFITRRGKVVRNPKWRGKGATNLVLHAEMMDDRSAFIDVAGLCLWVHVGRDGVARITHQEDRRG